MTARRVGVVVLDFGRPDDAARAVASARADDTKVRVLIVENGSPHGTASDEGHLRLADNRGFAGGMNAGLKQLLDEGCDRLLLLNNDAVLEPGCLRRLAVALEDSALAAVGPVILRDSDGRVESRGMSVNLRSGRMRLEGRGDAPPEEARIVPTMALSGAVLMVSRAALERVGFLDEAYFFSFEDVDWCVRARRAGLGLGVALNARARHVGSQTIGADSAELLYYATRSHIRLVEKLDGLQGGARWVRRLTILGLYLAHALRRPAARLAVGGAIWAGFRDGCRGLAGPRAL